MEPRRKGSENIVKIGNLSVLSQTASLDEVVAAVNKIIKENRDLVTKEREMPPAMFG